ncbi:MAG: YceI family protein [Actinomycetota bacterium]
MISPDQLTSGQLQEQLAAGSLAGNWTLDPAQSTATLRSKSVWGLAAVKGEFKEIGGSGTVSPAGDLTGEITITTASLDTKNPKRDKHLQSEEMLSSAKYPTITFVLGSVDLTSSDVTVAGSLTVRDETRPLTFTASVAVEHGAVVSLDTVVHVDRQDFGITWNQLGMASMQNEIAVHAVFKIAK